MHSKMPNFIPYGKQTIDDTDISCFIETLKSDFLTTGIKVNEFEQKFMKPLMQNIVYRYLVAQLLYIYQH